MRRRDRLGLAGRERGLIRFGDVIVRGGVRELRTVDSLNARPEARFRLSIDAVTDGIDYLAPVTITVRGGGYSHELFYGNVLHAKLEADGVALTCAGGQLLAEKLMGRFTSAFVPPPAIAHLAARTAGLSEERIVIPELEELPLQTFEVVAAVEEVDISEPVRIGRVTLLPAGSAESITDHLAGEDVDDFVAPFRAAPAYALVLVDGTVPFRAERQALETIDWVLAWLTMRLRYGSARLPGGALNPFTRSLSRTNPRRGAMVAIRGLLTGMRWLRETAVVPAAETVGLGAVRGAALPAEPPLEVRQSLLAASRSAAGGDVVQRAAAMWEAIEFLVRDVSVPKTLNKAQRKALQKSLEEALPAEQYDRIGDLIGLINGGSVKTKLRLFIDHHGIPISPGEFKLLDDLRDVRNKALHGKGADSLPDPESLDHALSILARILMYRLDS